MSDSTGVLSPRVRGTVRVVGAGLLGSSIGHALTATGVDVALDDTSPAQLRLAIDYGAGRAARTDDAPALIVVAVPPDVTADVIERELTRFPGAVVTDVASVKLDPLRTLRERGVDLTHYIGSHPLAGRERGGAISARADIFVGRPWVVCRDQDTSAADLTAVADALREPDAPGARRAVADTIRRGNDGVERLPGKHGQNRRFEQVVVMVDDTPGQLGRLFGELGDLDVNVEDLRLEHSPGAQFGLAEISVVPSAVRRAIDGLESRGWKIASTTND